MRGEASAESITQFISLSIAFKDLPGTELIEPGLADVSAGRITPNACLVAMVLPHLGRARVETPNAAKLIPEPERTLYALLCKDASTRDPYSRYNALKRRIVSFARALSKRDRVGGTT